MLAKELKVRELIRQRNFIKGELKTPRPDGDPSYRYIGYVFPENKKHFEENGYNVTTFFGVEVLPVTEGKPLNVFTPKDDIILTAEEEAESKQLSERPFELQQIVGDVLSTIFSDIANENDDNEEDDDAETDKSEIC